MKPFIALLALATLQAQPPAAILDTLPANLRPAGAEILSQQDPQAKRTLLTKLASAKSPEVARFAIALHAASACPEQHPTWKPTRPAFPCATVVLDTFARTADPALLNTLEQWAASAPDAPFAAFTAHSLLKLRAEQLTKLLDKRAALARAANDDPARLAIGRAQETIASRVPSFLWQPPAKFEAVPATPRIRVAAISDFGTGAPAQETLSASLLRLHHSTPLDFALTLGDNFQDDGPYSPSDPRWHTYFGRLFNRFNIPFYATLGNHDWNNPDGPPAELAHALKNPAWRLPALYYTFTAGPVQFFAVNTPLLSEAQLLWLDRELAQSTSPWKVVYGHYQIYSALRGDNAPLISNLLPILQRHKVDVYLCGHEHIVQHIKPELGVHFLVNGASGAGGREARIKPFPRALFMAENIQTFTLLEADAKSLTFKFIDLNGNQLYNHTLAK